MLREYAIQPEVLTTFENVRYFLDATGVHQGRMISRFPKNWTAMVYAACGGCRAIEKARIEVRLRTDLRDKLISTQRFYDGSGPSWVANALREHSGVNPFAGVILHETDSSPRSRSVISAEEINERCECWRTSHDAVVPRTAADLCCAARPLLNISQEIVLVDQYFSGGAAHGKPFTALLAEAAQGETLKRLEYHLSNRFSWDHFKDVVTGMTHFIRAPRGLPLRFVRWNQIPAGDGMHPRYVLTERGGLKYDWGLAEDTGTTTDVHLLDSGVYARRWNEYRASSTTFQFVDGIELLDGRLCRIGIHAGLFRNEGAI
jgi:hypothetical protein